MQILSWIKALFSQRKPKKVNNINLPHQLIAIGKGKTGNNSVLGSRKREKRNTWKIYRIVVDVQGFNVVKYVIAPTRKDSRHVARDYYFANYFGTYFDFARNNIIKLRQVKDISSTQVMYLIAKYSTRVLDSKQI